MESQEVFLRGPSLFTSIPWEGVEEYITEIKQNTKFP